MLYSNERMPSVFVLAHDWTLRTAVRAELRERGIDALGMDSAEVVGRAIASGQIPSALVVEGAAEFVSDPAIQNLMSRVPTILIASRTEKIPFPPAGIGGIGPGPEGQYRGVLLYRPVQVREIVARVLDFLRRGQAA